MINVVIIFAFIGIQVFSAGEEGKRKSQELRQRAIRSPNGIIRFSKKDIMKYALSFPRPYDLVIFHSIKSGCRICKTLQPQWEYLAKLHYDNGALYPKVQNGKVKNAVYFVRLEHDSQIASITSQFFEFKRIPNLFVSKPKMAVISSIQKKRYLSSYNWHISYSDGSVQTSKMLQFTNKRTQRDVVYFNQIIYEPKLLTMLTTLFVFILVIAIGYFSFRYFRSFFLNNYVWLVASLIIFIIFVSGIVYDILHDVPFVSTDKQGNVQLFSGGNRQQNAAQGLLVSSICISILLVVLFGILLILSVRMHKYLTVQYQILGSLILIIIALLLVKFLEVQYKHKGFFNPIFYPPDDYRTGSVMSDQGNMI